MPKAVAPLPTDAPVGAASLSCLRCGYDLHGLPPDGRCPECGLAVTRSADVDRELRQAHPLWIGRVAIAARALWWLQAAGVGALLVLVLLPGFADHLLPREHSAFAGFVALSTWVTLFAASVWLLTTPERRTGRRPRWRAMRWSLRACALGPPLSAAAETYEEFIRRGVLPVSLSTLLGLLIIPTWLLLFAYLRRVADSVLYPRLAEHCRIVLWGLGVSLGGYAALLISETLGIQFGSGTGVTIFFVTVFVATLLFLGWSCFLIYRFASALKRTARLARRSWSEADGAAGATVQ